jgi:hypothetical protein
MGFLDGILGGVVGAEALSLVKGYFEKHGGIEGVVADFERNGFGKQAKSWVSTGSNLPITPPNYWLGQLEGAGQQIRRTRRQGFGTAGQIHPRCRRQDNAGREAAELTPSSAK